jgi:hypothetical protein
MDLTIPKVKGTCRKGDKEAKKMAKEHEERKTWAIKLLEKVQTSYENLTNKSQRHIEFEVGDLMWWNIKVFKTPETFANRFVPKYASLYKIIYKPHPNVYILQLPMTLVAHLTFHVSRLKTIHENKKRKDKKQVYYLGFNFIEHKFVREVKCILAAR